MSSAGARSQKIEIVWSILGQRDLPQMKDLDGCHFLEIWLGPKVYMNSAGIREWLRWIKPAAEMEKLTIQLYKCPEAFIQLSNMIKEMIPKNAQVMSFYIPYFSKATEEQKMVLLTRGHEYVDDKISLPVVYDSTNQKMEVDVDQTRFFKFLNNPTIIGGE